jgi:uncharacterized membrane protein
MDLGSIFNTPDYTEQYASSDIEANKIWSGLAYLGSGILFFLPLVAGNNSAFGKFHANQALIYLIFDIIAGIAIKIVSHIPVIGSIISIVISIICLIFMLFGLINAFQGKAKSLPIIGELFQIIK